MTKWILDYIKDKLIFSLQNATRMPKWISIDLYYKIHIYSIEILTLKIISKLSWIMIVRIIYHICLFLLKVIQVLLLSNKGLSGTSCK